MKCTLKIIPVVLVAVVMFTIIWCFAYPRLFPERMKATQTKYQDWLQNRQFQNDA